jgi:hypothetical protein
MPRLPIDGIDERREVMAVSRFSTRAELLEDADGARRKLEDLISRIPDEALVIEVTDGMSTKDFLAHRTEWGRMMIRWYTEPADGGSPAVPSDRHTWRELPALNAEIHERFADISPTDARAQFAEVHDALRRLIASCTDDELFTKHQRPTSSPPRAATIGRRTSTSTAGGVPIVTPTTPRTAEHRPCPRSRARHRAWPRRCTRPQREKAAPRTWNGPLFKNVWQRPTLPGPFGPSTIGAGGLNFRVRNGNGWIPAAMVTKAM